MCQSGIFWSHDFTLNWCWYIHLCWTADILLHWVRIFLYRVTDERLGFSGFYNLNTVTVVTWYSIDSTLWFLVWLLILYSQQVLMYFRGSGKAAELKREAARGTMMAALWLCISKCFHKCYDPKILSLQLPVPCTFIAFLNTWMFFPDFWSRFDLDHIIKERTHSGCAYIEKHCFRLFLWHITFPIEYCLYLFITTGSSIQLGYMFCWLDSQSDQVSTTFTDFDLHVPHIVIWCCISCPILVVQTTQLITICIIFNRLFFSLEGFWFWGFFLLIFRTTNMFFFDSLFSLSSIS